jgi:hypothetical protein
MTHCFTRFGLLALVGLGLLACTAEIPSPPLPDTPVRATSTPATGLLMTASINHGLLSPGIGATLDVALKNTGSTPARVPAGGLCSPALQISVQDGGGRTVWSEPMPMCAALMPPAPLILQPGQSLTGSRCVGLQVAPQGCSSIELPAGTYQLTGGFHGFGLPPLQLRVSPHLTPSGPNSKPGVRATAVPGGQVTGAPVWRTEPHQGPD